MNDLVEKVARATAEAQGDFLTTADLMDSAYEDGARAAIAAVLDDLIQRAPLGRTESPVQFLSRAKRGMPLPAAVAPQDAPNADSGTTTPERGQGRTTRDER